MPDKRTDIFKVQLPNSPPTKSAPLVLIYNHSRSQQFMIDQTPQILEFMGDKLKKFVYGITVDDETELDFSQDAPWQEW